MKEESMRVACLGEVDGGARERIDIPVGPFKWPVDELRVVEHECDLVMGKGELGIVEFVRRCGEQKIEESVVLVGSACDERGRDSRIERQSSMLEAVA